LPRGPSNKIVLPDNFRQDSCEIHGVTVFWPTYQRKETKE